MSDGPNLAGQRFALIANFPPNSGPSERHSGGLAHMLRSSGADVITASETGRSYARIPLVYRTRRLFSATREALFGAIADAEHVVIYASALRTENIEKPRWRSRRMEEWRRFRLAFSAARAGKRCIIVFDAGWQTKPFWITAALAAPLFMLMPIRITNMRHGPSRLLETLTGVCAPVPPIQMTIDTSYELAQYEQQDEGDRRLSPLEIQRVVRGINDIELRAELEQIRRISAEIIGMCRQFSTLDKIAAPRLNSKMALANQIDESGLTHFMQHYRAGLRPSTGLPDGASTDDTTFLDWYLHSKSARCASPHLPIPNELITCSSDIFDAARTILKFAHRIEQIAFLPPHLHDYFTAPIVNGAGNLSRMELIIAVGSKLPLTSRMLSETPWQAEEIRAWFAKTVCSIAPSMKVFSTAAIETSASTPSIEIAGIVDGDSGLAKNATMSAAAFQSLGLAANMRQTSDLSNPRVLAPRPPLRTLERSVILHNANADRLPQQILARALSSTINPLHIGYLLWELNGIPKSHCLAGQLLDDIWSPTKFVQQIYQHAYARDVVNIGKAISLPDVHTANLNRYGIDDQAQVFLTCFDVNSSVERKNPLAAVIAFLEAFPTTPCARLIIKATPERPNAWGDPSQQMKAIRRLARKDQRIIVIEETLSFNDLISLIKRADCIVSTHRAEGFGYIPAYGLSLAKPVIVTDYSGTQDFCNTDTAYPIAYKMIEPRRGEIIAPVEGAEWADIDVSAVAAAMQQVLADPEDAKRRGLAGQALMQTYYSPDSHAARYLARLKELGAVA